MNLHLRKLLDNDKFLKILSVVIAIIAWVIVSFVINPEITLTIADVPLTINISDSAAGALGLDVISGQEQKVTVTVEGKRYIVGALTSEDISATVNLASVVAPGDYELDIIALKKRSTQDYNIVSVRPKTVKLSFDRVSAKELTPEVDAANIKAKDNYIIGKIYVLPETIKVSGPEQSVEKISKVVVKTSRNDIIDKTLVTRGHIEYYDKENNVLALPDVTTQPSVFEITVPVYKKSSVSLKFDYINAPPNFDVSNLKFEMSHTELEIAAPTDAKSNLTEINLGVVDLRKLEIDSKVTLDVILPSGYININNVQTVDVTFKNESYSSKNLKVTNFQLVNVAAEYNVSILTSNINNVKLIAKSDVIDGITANDLIARVDLSEIQLNVGQFSVPVKIYVQDRSDCWIYGEYTAIISVSLK